jgi:hypothetical protein
MKETELLMRRRYFYSRDQKHLPGTKCESVRRESAYCPYGLRRKDSMIWYQAIEWNVGTCRFNVKRELQAQPRKGESIEVKHRGGSTRSSEECTVMVLERRGRIIKSFVVLTT